jgi:hypothetical protein
MTDDVKFLLWRSVAQLATTAAFPRESSSTMGWNPRGWRHREPPDERVSVQGRAGRDVGDGSIDSCSQGSRSRRPLALGATLGVAGRTRRLDVRAA